MPQSLSEFYVSYFIRLTIAIDASKYFQFCKSAQLYLILLCAYALLKRDD